MTTPQDQQLHAQHITAYFSKPAHELRPGLPTAAVHVQYVHHAFNTYRQRHEAIYHCYEGLDHAGYLGTWYYGALERFNE